MLSSRSKFFGINLKHSLEAVFVLGIVLSLFVFTVRMSPLPVGDDPGYHSMVLRQLIEGRTLHFTLPFFPSLQQQWGLDRFVTPLFLSFVGKMVGNVDYLAWPRIFAALCMALNLIPFYLLARRITKSAIPTILGTIFLATTKFYQENFWEGNYEQYTGLLFLTIILWHLFRLYETKKYKYLIWAILFEGVLFKTHQLGFLVGLSCIGAAGVWYLYQQATKKLFWTCVVATGILALWVFPKISPGFALNTVDYPIIKILSEQEGVSVLAMILFIGGFFTALRKRSWPVLGLLVISVVFSQSFYLDAPFYAYRFNLYFMMSVGIFIALGYQSLLTALSKKFQVSAFMGVIAAILFLLSIVAPQIHYTYGLWDWLSSPTRNPASVILQSDINAMHWAEKNTPKNSVFIGPLKWGYYIPAIANRSVILTDAVGGDQRDARYPQAQLANTIFLSKDAKQAATIMRDLGARYVYFSSSIQRFPDRYPGYSSLPFEQKIYFTKVYQQDGVKIYELR